MTVRRWSAIALVFGFAWACDYTPNLPPAPAPTPRPSVTNSDGIPVIVVPVPQQTPSPIASAVPVPSSAPFRIVLATPEDTSTIKLPADSPVRLRRPIIDFEFKYPQSLTLDKEHTNIRIVLESRRFDCLWTDIGYATRLDRDDSVYIANSVARFRTGIWQKRFENSGPCAREPFTTDVVVFLLPTAPGVSAAYGVPMGWNFVSN